MKKKLVNKIVAAVHKELAVDSNLESYKVEFGKCSRQLEINKCGIHTIAILVSMAQKQEPNITLLDFEGLRWVYAEACCTAFVGTSSPYNWLATNDVYGVDILFMPHLEIARLCLMLEFIKLWGDC